ncbi:MAG: DEAD/DEAH box helicase [Euryarchaeota archaeon]|nr:DEAD/DEAH box helicase [Euryarchaeota archaeon]
MAASPKTVQGTFEELGLSETSLKALESMGYVHPTPIQAQAIPIVLEGKDLIGQARTGTGKTAAFGLPIIEKVDPKDRSLQALVLCPTRELAVQVAKEMDRMSAGRDVEVLAVYGGAKMESQTASLRKGVQVVVGTPGRVMDHMRRNNLSVAGLRFIVLDEADRMLDMGFIEDITWICGHAPPKGSRQMLLFSATLPLEVVDIADQFMVKPTKIQTLAEQLTVPDIEQVYYSVGRKNKIWALARIIEHEKPKLMLVFCATKRMVDRLTETLNRYEYGAEAIHGDLSQQRRERVLEKFRQGKINILVATDVAARGLDIEDITHVVNYDLPEEPEVYVHRIGRTGRAGRKGKAISFIAKGDKHQLEIIERLAGTDIPLSEVPGEEEADADEQPKRGREKVRKVLDWDHIADRYGNVLFEMDIGRNEGANMVKVHRLIQKVSDIPEHMIADIEVTDDRTRFRVPKEYAHRLQQTLEREKWEGRRMKVDFIPEEEH